MAMAMNDHFGFQWELKGKDAGMTPSGLPSFLPLSCLGKAPLPAASVSMTTQFVYLAPPRLRWQTGVQRSRMDDIT